MIHVARPMTHDIRAGCAMATLATVAALSGAIAGLSARGRFHTNLSPRAFSRLRLAAGAGMLRGSTVGPSAQDAGRPA